MLFQYRKALFVDLNLANTHMSTSFKSKVKAAYSGK
jgi:hypothetical protein